MNADVSLPLQMKCRNPGCFSKLKILKITSGPHLFPSLWGTVLYLKQNSQWLILPEKSNKETKEPQWFQRWHHLGPTSPKSTFSWNTSWIGEETLPRFSCIQNQGFPGTYKFIRSWDMGHQVLDAEPDKPDFNPWDHSGRYELTFRSYTLILLPELLTCTCTHKHTHNNL